MKRFIICAVMSVGAALAGMFGVSGYIEADAVTGVQSQQLAQVVADFAVEPLLRIQGDVDGTNYVDAVRTEFYTTNAASQAKIVALQEGTNGWNAAAALAATALQPSWAATGTVANAQRLVSADGSLIWTEIENGTNWQYCVTNAVGVEGDREKVIVTGWAMYEPGEYNGLPSNTVMSVTYKDDAGDGTWIYASGEWELRLREGMENTIVLSGGWVGIPPLPATITGGTPTISDVTIDWYGPVTNRYPLATQTGTVILLSEHDADAGAHPTLPRSNDVVNIVGAATNPLLSKAEAAATYLPLANIPGPGCTDISASGVISGATYNYLVSSTTNWALSVSASAPRYNYHVRVLSTNNVVFSDMVLFGSYDQGYTNSIVVGPYTGDDWQAQGGMVQ